MERVDGLHMRPLQSCVPSSVEQLLRAQLTTSRTLTVSIAVVIIWPTRGARISVLHDDNNAGLCSSFYAVKIYSGLFSRCNTGCND